MYKIGQQIKNLFDHFVLLIMICVGLFALLIDCPKYENKGFIKEYRIVKIISYTYIALGIIIFIFVRNI